MLQAFLLLFLLCGHFSPDTLAVMSWNLENFFDWTDGGTGESDTEFSARGSRHWTRKKFEAKARAIGKTVVWAGEEAGCLPDIIAVQEVENAFVLRRLIDRSVLRKLDYAFVHFESPDRRGIDVGLLYRSTTLSLVHAVALPVRAAAPKNGPRRAFQPPSRSSAELLDTLFTRDILLAQLEDAGGRRWSFLVCHFPSKYGGGDSDWRREAAAHRLRAIADSLHAAGEQRILAIGDFNDTPDSPVFRLLTQAGASASSADDRTEDSEIAGSSSADDRTENRGIAGLSSTEPAGKPAGPPLVNLAEPLSRRGTGTIRFEGRWQLIDQVFVSAGLAPSCTLSILHPPFLTAHDNVHSGDKPLRTYSGPRYLGGVSDHRPLLLLIRSP